MVLETSRGTLQSLPGDGASWEGRALWFARPGRREAANMVRRSRRVRAGGLGPQGSAGLARWEYPGREIWSFGVLELRAWCSGGEGGGPRGQGPGCCRRLTRLPRGAERRGLSRILCTPGWVVREHRLPRRQT